MNSIEILKRHLLMSFRMLENIIAHCPDDLWSGSDENRTIWKRVFHVLESIDYWFDDFDEYTFPIKFPQYIAELDETNPSPLQQNVLSDYSKIIMKKIENYFNNLDSSMLTDHSIKHPKVTFLDIILCQIRHIQINIGYCNEKFNNFGYKGTDWAGYEEE
jgi:hypothetical protein